MTVALSPRHAGPFTMSEGQTIVDYDFPIDAASELRVQRLRAGADERLELDVDYGVTHVGEAEGTIILTSGSVAGDVIDIYGDLPIERVSGFSGFKSIPNNAVNEEFDRMIKALQEMRRDVDSTIKRVLAGQVYDFEGHRLTNLASGVDGNDAVTVTQMNSVVVEAANLIDEDDMASNSPARAPTQRSVVAWGASKSGRNIFQNYEPVYDLNGNGEAGTVLSVQNYFHVGDITVPDDKQHNVFRFNGIFRGGLKVKGIDFNFDVYDAVDSYAIISNLNNHGAGNTKALYGRATMLADAGVGFALVGGVGWANGITPGICAPLQLTLDGDGIGGWLAYCGTDQSPSVRSIQGGMLLLNTLGITDTVLKAFAAIGGATGSFLRWRNSTGYDLFEVDYQGQIFKRNGTNGSPEFTVNSNGNVVLGSASNIDKSLQLFSTAGPFTIIPTTSDTTLRVLRPSDNLPVMRLKGGALSSTQTSLQLLVNNNSGEGNQSVSLGAADSAGSGFRALRVPN
jgi:hypothetical protein